MTVMVVPNRVVKAQAELLSMEVESFLKDIDDVLPRLGLLGATDMEGVTGNSPMNQMKHLANVHEFMLDVWREALDCSPGSGAVRSDSSFAYRQDPRSSQVERSELLIGRVNFRLGQPLLWLLGLLSATPVNACLCACFGIDAAAGEVLRSASDIIWKLIEEPSPRDIRRCIATIEERDYPIARRAVELSCGNPFGVTAHPKIVSIREVHERCVSSSGNEKAPAVDEIVDALCAAADNIPPSIDINTDSVRRKIISVIKKRLPPVMQLYRDLAGSPVITDDFLFMSEEERLQRCQQVLDSLVEARIFRRAGFARESGGGGWTRLDARVVSRGEPQPDQGEAERIVLDVRVMRDADAPMYMYRLL